MNELHAQMFDFGPLHENRFGIVKLLEQIPIQTGDIFYRASNAKGPLGIPFSRLVAHATKSHYSHAAIALIQNNEPWIVEINDQGTTVIRLIDWMDTCYTNHFAVYRLKNSTPEILQKLETEIQKILNEDVDYDFCFDDPGKLYCTESVALVYKNIGIELVKPELIKEVIHGWGYWAIVLGSFLLKPFKCSLPLKIHCYYVGNEKHGLISSDKTNLIFNL